tara:strand:- start:857 stop:985 length:129 start_codon:yes stop_codon:yes gene_type:complete
VGKGSKRRPQVVNQKQFEKAWDNIFPKKKHKDKSKQIPKDYK